MKNSNIAFDIISALVVCILSWIVFSVASNRFEVVVISGLVFIYANVVFIRVGIASLIGVNVKLIIEVLSKIKPKDDDITEVTKELDQQSINSMPKYFVATGKFVVLEAIVIWKLIEEFIIK